jgi:excisionase family DNA binding protein
MTTAVVQEPPVDDRPIWTVKEVADYLRVHPETVRQWLREGELVGMPLGGKGGWRIERANLERFIEQQTRRP